MFVGNSVVFVACEARFERTVGVHRQLTACGAAAATWVWVTANAPRAVEVPKMLMFRCVASFLGHLRWMERSMVDRKSLGVSPKRGRFVSKVWLTQVWLTNLSGFGVISSFGVFGARVFRAWSGHFLGIPKMHKLAVFFFPGAIFLLAKAFLFPREMLSGHQKTLNLF